MDKYIDRLEIPSYMTDIENRLRAASFMELAQEMAGKGAEQLDFSDDKLAAINAVWVLARMHVRFEKTPMWKDKVELQTWHKGLRGIQFLRDYKMLSESGETLVNSTSSWLIMDFAERRMVSGDVLRQYVSTDPQCEDAAIENACPKVVVPAAACAEQVAVHRVCYSDVDHNRHTNNTRYIQWAMDVLPDELVYQNEVSEFFINFNKESHPSENVVLLRGEMNGDWYVEGRSEEGQQLFVCKFVFR